MSIDRKWLMGSRRSTPVAAAFGLLTAEVIGLREEIAELRAEMKSKPGGLLSKREVAKRLGVADRTVDRMIENGELPPGRWVGSRRRWTIDEINGAVK